MDAQRAKAFEFAKDSANLLITLSTGFLGLSITFGKDILGVGGAVGVPASLLVSWVAFFLCALFGAWVHFALTGELEPKSDFNRPASIRNTNVTLPATLQVLAFLIGLAAALWFGVFVEPVSATSKP